MSNQLSKHVFFSGILFFQIIACFGQQGFERTIYIEINERADFYHVDDRYEIISDTIFYCKAGFLVDPNYGIKKDGDKEYVILKYPNYGSDNYQIEKPEIFVKNRIGAVDSNAIYISIVNKSGRTLMIEKTKFDNLSKTTLYSTKWIKGGNWYNIMPEWRNYRITSGLLTVPFKLRPKMVENIDTTNFNLTTDVTLGPYIGVTKRFSKRNPFYVTVPATLGLSFININNNTTSNQIMNGEIGVVPGISWSSGLVFQFDKFNLGFVLGRDYASGIGDDWIYQGETWYSFAIGYSFFNDENN